MDISTRVVNIISIMIIQIILRVPWAVTALPLGFQKPPVDSGITSSQIGIRHILVTSPIHA